MGKDLSPFLPFRFPHSSLTMNISYLTDYNPETNPEFATRWANHWKQYHIESLELDELMTTRNNRSGIINTQKQFERHIHQLMNHRPHQQEF